MRRRDRTDTDSSEYPEPIETLAHPTDPIVDPVCGAAVAPEEAVGPSTYGEERYFFCSGACQRRFELSPDEYASARQAIRIPLSG
jgi:YHS domain-containing protein